MLGLFKSNTHAHGVNGNAQDVLTEGWQPGLASVTANGSWSRKDENKDGINGADICWDTMGAVDPLGLRAMTEEEREVCLQKLLCEESIAYRLASSSRHPSILR